MSLGALGGVEDGPRHKMRVVERGYVADVGQNVEYRLREAFSDVRLVSVDGKNGILPGPCDGDRAWQRIQWRHLPRLAEDFGHRAARQGIVDRLQDPRRREAIPIARRVAHREPTDAGRFAQEWNHGPRDTGHRQIPPDAFRDVWLQAVAFRPEASWREGAHARRPATASQLDRHVSAKGVARQIRSMKAVLIQVVLGGVDDIGDGDGASLRWRAAAVAERCWREHLMLLGEKRNHFLPCKVGSHPDAVQQHQSWFIGGHSRKSGRTT